MYSYERIPTVAVLMSTFNGEEYIEEQVRSILEQRGVVIQLYVRDDGSKDGTIAKIKALQDNRITIYSGRNIGVVSSFFDLINKVPNCYDYYAFSDQDDVWKNEKLSAAIYNLKKFPTCTPCLYYSALDYVDAELNRIKTVTNCDEISFEFSLCRSVFPGCTMVFNKCVFQIIKMYNPQKQIMHDLLVYQLVAGCGGEIIYDEKSYIFHRLHGKNVSDFSDKRKRIRKLLNNFGRDSNIRQNALIELRDGYGVVLSIECREVLKRYAAYSELNFARRIMLGLKIPDRIQYKVMCAVLMAMKKF